MRFISLTLVSLLMLPLTTGCEAPPPEQQIGRASCRERVYISVVAVSLKKFFFNDTATTEIYTLSLHDALPICCSGGEEAPLLEIGRAHV